MDNSIFLNSKKFIILKLLGKGKGKGGYSYLVTDGENKFVLKQIHHEPCSYYSFGNKLESELNDYKTLKSLNLPIPELLDVDIPNGRILKTFIDGDTILEYVLNDKVQETFLSQIKDICKILYKNNLNIDYFPTNFIVENNKIYYIDYECNDYMEKWNFENWGINYWSKTDIFLDYIKNK